MHVNRIEVFLKELFGNLKLDFSISDLEAIRDEILNIPKHKQILIVGNGGNAATAMHVAQDYRNILGVNAVSLPDASYLTMLVNDYGWDYWITEYMNSLDLGYLIALSVSGSSKNIVNAAKYAKRKNIKVFSLMGPDENCPLSKYSDHRFYIDSKNYNVVEIMHSVILLSLCER